MTTEPAASDPLGWIEARPGRRLACRRRAGRGPTLIFLPGYMSDMEGGKASALDAWAAGEGRAMLRFDYGGCGASPGAFEAQSLADWRDDALAAIDSVEGPVVLVGSSMGGWVMLLAAIARPARVAGLVGIAAAPDFTRWGFSDEEKARLRDEGRIAEPSPYSDSPYVTTFRFWESGESLRLLDDAVVPIDCPVRLLHGQRDEDVPWPLSLELADKLRSADVQVTLVKGGDHRLSREEDVDLLVATVSRLLERP